MKKFLLGVLITVSVLFTLLLLIPLDEDSDYSEGVTSSSDEEKKKSKSDNNGDYEVEDKSEILSRYFDTSIVRNRRVKLKGDGTDTVTVLVYMNGSNLESEAGEATIDISEMVAAGTSDNVNVIIQTMGTKSWSDDYGISAKRSQRYKVVDDGIELVDDSLKQLDCTKASTLSDFIKWGVKNYPADRYILQLWDHGAGPVYGYGYDEWQSEDATLTIDEMQQALKDGGVYFDFIGMDCCIMSCMEVCMALYDYCDYMILSEDFESGLGWEYTGWLSALNENPSIDTVSLGKIAIDDNVDANEDDYEGGSACLALIDQSVMKLLYAAWTEFAYANQDELFAVNYSQLVESSDRAHPRYMPPRYDDDYGYYDFFSNFNEEALLSDYYITDIMAVAQNIKSDESDSLSAAISSTIVYSRSTSDNEYLTGLSVTLPYGDREFYSVLKSVFSNCGFDSEYIKWLGYFVTAEGAQQFYDYYEDWGDDWEGWGQYEDDYDWEGWGFYDDDEFWEDDDCWGWDDCYYDDDDYGYYYYDDDYEYYDDEDYEYYYEDDDDDWWYEEDDDDGWW